MVKVHDQLTVTVNWTWTGKSETERWRHPLRAFRPCLHVGINARRVSVTYFLLGQLVPQCSTTVDAALFISCKRFDRMQSDTSSSRARQADTVEWGWSAEPCRPVWVSLAYRWGWRRPYPFNGRLPTRC